MLPADHAAVQLLREEGEGDGVGDGAVACGGRVEVVSAVVGGEELVGMAGVADYGVEIEDGIEVAGANPGVDGLAVGFAEGAGVVVGGADVGGDGGSEDAEAVGVGAGDDLLIGGKNAGNEGVVIGGGNFAVDGEATEIVDAFKDDEVADAGLGEDIAIEAGESVGAKAVGEEVIAADASVGDANVGSRVLGLGCRGWGRGLEAGGEDVGPAVVAVGGCAVSVGDGVAEGDYCSRRGDSQDINGGDLVPVVNVFGRVEFGGGDGVPVDIVGSGAGAGVACLDGGRRVVVDADGEVGEGGDGRVDGIGEDFGSWRDGDIGVASEGEGAVGGGVNGRVGGRDGVGDVDGGEVERGGSESVGDMDAESVAAEREVEDLAEGSVAEVVRGEGILGLGDLLGGGPGDDPGGWLWCGRGGLFGENRQGSEEEECEGRGEFTGHVFILSIFRTVHCHSIRKVREMDWAPERMERGEESGECCFETIGASLSSVSVSMNVRGA